MTEGERSSRLEDIPDDLYQDIQSRLPVEEAARTSVLSKSWLQAWSTIRILRFPRRAVKKFSNNKEDEEEDEKSEEKREKERKQMEEVMDRTLMRYLRDNIPIESIYCSINMTTQKSASLAIEKWIRPVAIKRCLKHLSLTISVSRAYSFTLPPEILSGQNLTDINISSNPVNSQSQIINPLSISHPVINCVSLRRLQLNCVHIGEEVLDQIFSVCRSTLVNVDLSFCTGFRTVKVQNLHRLHQFTIGIYRGDNIVLEINDVPNIRLVTSKGIKSLPLMTSLSLASVTKLELGGMIIDDAFLRIIESNFLFLESLTLDMKLSNVENFDIKFCASMKRLRLLSCPHMLIGVKVYSPKLVSFCFFGKTMPRLLFTANVVVEEMQIEVSLTRQDDPMDFFLKMREAFALSTKCDIQIGVNHDVVPSDMINLDLNDLRRKVPFPAMNVQQLSFEAFSHEESLWPESCFNLFCDALFLICHPKYIVDQNIPNNNQFCKLMVREVLTEKKKARNNIHWVDYLRDQFWKLMVREVLMEKKKTRNNLHWVDYLKDVEIRRRGCDETWKTLTNSWTSFLEGSADLWPFVEFILNWHSIG